MCSVLAGSGSLLDLNNILQQPDPSGPPTSMPMHGVPAFGYADIPRINRPSYPASTVAQLSKLGVGPGCKKNKTSPDKCLLNWFAVYFRNYEEAFDGDNDQSLKVIHEGVGVVHVEGPLDKNSLTFEGREYDYTKGHHPWTPDCLQFRWNRMSDSNVGPINHEDVIIYFPRLTNRGGKVGAKVATYVTEMDGAFPGYKKDSEPAST